MKHISIIPAIFSQAATYRFKINQKTFLSVQNTLHFESAPTTWGVTYRSRGRALRDTWRQ